MKCILPAIFLFLSIVLGSAGALNLPDSELAMKRSSDTCGNPADAQPYYTWYYAPAFEYYYTAHTSQVFSAAKPFLLKGVSAFVFATQEEGTVPFYRLANAAITQTLYTTSTTEIDDALQNGWHVDTGVTCYIYPTQVCGSIPFYRLYNAAQQSNFYTASESERLDFISNNGYTDVEIAGYVLPVTPAQCT
ncbi:hypothetical protein B0H13DRAFT_302340, partial [Mycena leptocephala]